MCTVKRKTIVLTENKKKKMFSIRFNNCADYRLNDTRNRTVVRNDTGRLARKTARSRKKSSVRIEISAPDLVFFFSPVVILYKYYKQ